MNRKIRIGFVVVIVAVFAWTPAGLPSVQVQAVHQASGRQLWFPGTRDAVRAVSLALAVVLLADELMLHMCGLAILIVPLVLLMSGVFSAPPRRTESGCS
jgi:hypothetical protein